MQDKLKDIRDRMLKLSTGELLRIVNIDFAAYRKEAIEIAKEELKKRNDIKQITEQSELDRNVAELGKSKRDRKVSIKIDSYTNNSFRILGLPSNASSREIARREKEIIALINIGQEYISRYDFQCLGPLKRTEECVREASRKLQDPYSRLLEEIFWFTNNSPVDEFALSSLTAGDITQAHFLWSEAIDKSKSIGDIFIASLWNLVILDHALLINDEVKDIVNKTTGTTEKDKIERWKKVIDNWTILLNNPKFFNMIAMRAKSIEEKRFSNDILQEILSKGIPERLAQINLTFLKFYLDDSNFEFIKIHGKILNSDSLKGSAEEGLKESLTSLNNKIEETCNEVHGKLKSITTDLLPEDVVKICDESFQLIQNNAVPLQEKIDLITSVVPNVISYQIIGKDTIARALNVIALELNNSGKNIQAESILLKAILYAASDSLKELINNNINIISKSASLENFKRETDIGHYKQAAEYYSKMRSLFDKENEEQIDVLQSWYRYYCKKRFGSNFTTIFEPKKERTVIGIGTKYYGKWDYDKLTDSYFTTRYAVLFNIPIIPLRRYRVSFKKDGSKKIIGQLPYGGVNSVHLLLVVVLGIFLLTINTKSENQPSKSRYRESPPIPAPRTYPYPETPYQLSDSLSELKASIMTNNSRLANMKSELNDLDSSLNNLKSKIENLKSDIKYRESIGMEVSYLIREHDNLVGSFNSKLRRFKDLYTEYDMLFNATNSMIAEYNRGIRR